MTQLTPFRFAALAAIAFSAFSLAACRDLTVQDQNSGSLLDLQNHPTPVSLETATQGLMYGTRFDMPLQVILVGAQGREGYSLDPSDPGWRNVLVIFDNTSFYAGSFFNWRDIYRNVRTELVVLKAADAVTGLSDAQKAGIKGFTRTFEALDLLNVIVTRDVNGAIIDPNPDYTGLPGDVVAVDAVYARINQLLDQGLTDLQTAGSTFAIALTPGFSAFSTPAGFIKFNRALRARAAIYEKDYAAAVTALAASFVDTTKSLSLGAFHSFSTNSGDALPNPLLFDPIGRVLVAHPTFATDAQMQVDGVTPDARFVAKTIKLPTLRSFNGLTSQYAFNVYPTNVSPVPIIRNEDLILLRSEAEWFTGNKAGALADLEFIRRVSGNLPKSALTPGSSDVAYVDELLYNRRYSLIWEGGHRWIDMRRFGRLSQLPIDRTTDHVFSAWPLPSDECINRSPQPAGCAQPVVTVAK